MRSAPSECRRRAVAAVAVVVLLAAGCAVLPGMTIRKGEFAPGRYLATVHVVARGDVPDECAIMFGLVAACARVRWVDTPAGRVGTADVVLPRQAAVSPQFYEMLAHEWCHVLAQMQAPVLLGADPCHREDVGVIRRPES